MASCTVVGVGNVTVVGFSPPTGGGEPGQKEEHIPWYRRDRNIRLHIYSVRDSQRTHTTPVDGIGRVVHEKERVCSARRDAHARRHVAV